MIPASRPTHPSRPLALAVGFALLVSVRSGVNALADEPPATTAAGAAASAEAVRFFELNVRPVLAESCNGCHGASKAKAGLRLDSRAAVLAGGDSGPSVVPGNPGESPLIAAIRYEGPEMPPKGKLPQKQVEALTQWVQMGAPWPSEGEAPVETAKGGEEPASNIRRPGYAVTDADRSFWAFRPLARPEVPAARPGQNPIDSFVEAGLKTRKLVPNPPASKATLIRRAYYDLTGLPPTLAEVEAFEKDAAPNAFAKVVDRLLESPRYGEKWGRHWLDLVRYAETNSYERDNPKPNVWRYRDYVIRSFNDDKPYGQFVREQLAGDELPNAGINERIATGYYRLGLWDDEPADRDQALYDEYDDIVATTGQVFLGLTIDCARCHDHKLDAIPQKDYYRFLSFFRNINPYRNGGPTDEVPFFSSDEERARFEVAHREVVAERDKVEVAISKIENDFRRAYAAEHGGGSAEKSRDLADLTYRFYRDSFEQLPDFDALKPEDTGTLPDGQFDINRRTRDDSFGFVFEGQLIVPEDGEYTISLTSDDGAKVTVGGKPVIFNDGIHGEQEVRSATLQLNQGRTPIRVDYFQLNFGWGLHLSWSGPGFKARSLSAPNNGSEPEVAAGDDALAPGKFDATMRREAAKLLGKDVSRKYFALRRERDKLRKKDAPADRALVLTEKDATPPVTNVMLRGNPRNPGDPVEPAFPQLLATHAPTLTPASADAKSSGRRLVLANWIADPSNGLANRVMANRIWQFHFGRGIVRSSSNFGTQGDVPTHPELLDWLAAEFAANGGHLKPLHRLIMASEAYQRSSAAQADDLAADPINDGFWRFDMRRLTSEEIRDSILTIAGELNTEMYGKSVYPDIPDEVKAGQSVPGNGWFTSSNEDQTRRSIYVHVKRSLLLPILESFDQAETDRSTPVRFVTTQPTQALGMINGEFLNAESRKLGDRLRAEAPGDVRKQVARAIALTTCRQPGEAEVDRGEKLVTGLVGEGLPADQALDTFCLVVLNLNEFIYLD